MDVRQSPNSRSLNSATTNDGLHRPHNPNNHPHNLPPLQSIHPRPHTHKPHYPLPTMSQQGGQASSPPTQQHPPHHQQLPPLAPQPYQPPPVKVPTKKRKKLEQDMDDPSGPSSSNGQPPARRLRRLHEACARCRSKKIKCDSKLPSCTSCTTANVECNQEDRHRQTLKPRGYTDLVEAHLAKSILLLEKVLPGFNLVDIDGHLDRYGIHLPSSAEPPTIPGPDGTFVTPLNAALNSVLLNNSGALQGAPAMIPVKIEPMNMVMGPPPPPMSVHDPPFPDAPADVPGQDPHANDLSSTGGLIKAFGVSRAIVRDLPKLDSSEGEDLLGGVRLEDDTPLPTYPKMVSQWTARPLKRLSGVLPPMVTSSGSTPGSPPSPFPHANLAFRLPENRQLTEMVVRKYFDRLNIHRPVFVPDEFHQGLGALYDSLEGGVPRRSMSPLVSVPPLPESDPGFLCSVYLILALGRLCVDNEHMHDGNEGYPESMMDYPTHEEFFELALAVKPDLRVTTSSLQALILLQWYLYTERHGRTLWRLVGNLVRLSIELGLHHDPSEQGSTFTPAECELRNRLWWTVLIHDRGTSVLLGRPLAIADADFNTPFPKRYGTYIPGPPFSEHFEHSPHLTSIQGDIINALYRPGNHKQTADQVVRHASRITKGLGAFSRGILGPTYRAFFEGTEGWSNEQKIGLVSQMTEDQGLTLLKYGIARILLLRALFTNNILGPDARRRALKDAVITSHNILTIQIQLTSFPSLAFFVSPIPIHIAAMVILYGVISECDALPFAKAKEDVCSALHIVPLFRWRWNRKDAHGSHPLIVKLAQKVFGHDVLNVTGPLGPPLLIPEWDWTTGQAEPLPPSPGITPPTLNGSNYDHQNGMYPVDPATWGEHHPSHSRNMSNGTALPPTPVSAVNPNVAQMMMSGSSPSGGTVDEAEIVRFMYPPPLGPGFYDDSPQQQQPSQQPQSQMHSGPPQPPPVMRQHVHHPNQPVLYPVPTAPDYAQSAAHFVQEEYDGKHHGGPVLDVGTNFF